MYREGESLSCTPKANVTFGVNCTQIKIFFEKNHVFIEYTMCQEHTKCTFLEPVFISFI